MTSVAKQYWLVIVGTFVIVGVVLVAAGAALSYWLMSKHISAIQVAQVHQQAVQAHQQALQALKTAQPVCRGVRKMDRASNGAVFTGGSIDTYGRKLSAAIHSFFVSSKCESILNGTFRVPK